METKTTSTTEISKTISKGISIPVGVVVTISGAFLLWMGLTLMTSKITYTRTKATPK